MKLIYLCIVIISQNLMASMGIEQNSPIQSLQELFMNYLTGNIPYFIVTFVLFTLFVNKVMFSNNTNITYEKEKTNYKKEETKKEEKVNIKENELTPFFSLKKELDFILNNNIKSELAKDRINSLLNTFETRFKKNLYIIKSLSINTNEIDFAKSENEKILTNLKELIFTTKIKKEEFDLEENTEQIKEYIDLLNKTN